VEETFEVTILPDAPEKMQFNTHAGMERAYNSKLAGFED
jgi:hypothetical protein